jgi:hypothetical protein
VKRSRSAQPEVINPVLALDGVAQLAALPADVRALIAAALLSIQADARAKAEKCWRTHKAPMAVYWKCVGVYAGHLARAIKKPR